MDDVLTPLHTLSQSAVHIWVDSFKEGRNSVKSRHSPGRPTEDSTEKCDESQTNSGY